MLLMYGRDFTKNEPLYSNKIKNLSVFLLIINKKNNE